MADRETEQIQIEEFLARKNVQESSQPAAAPPATNRELAKAYLTIMGMYGRREGTYRFISRRIAAIVPDICEFYREHGTLDGFDEYEGSAARTTNRVIGKKTGGMLEEILREGIEPARKRIRAERERDISGPDYVGKTPHQIHSGEDLDNPTFHNVVRAYEQ